MDKNFPEVSIKYRPANIERKPIRDAEDMVEFILNLVDKDEFQVQEKVVVLLLDHADMPIGGKVLFTGTKTSVQIDHRMIYQLALVCGAEQVVVAHNHPGKDLQPSDEDIKSAITGASMGKILGVLYRDDIILCLSPETEEVEYFSLAENGII